MVNQNDTTMDAMLKESYKESTQTIDDLYLECGLPITNVVFVEGVKHVLVEGDPEPVNYIKN